MQRDNCWLHWALTCWLGAGSVSRPSSFTVCLSLTVFNCLEVLGGCEPPRPPERPGMLEVVAPVQSCQEQRLAGTERMGSESARPVTTHSKSGHTRSSCPASFLTSHQRTTLVIPTTALTQQICHQSPASNALRRPEIFCSLIKIP